MPTYDPILGNLRQLTSTEDLSQMPGQQMPGGSDSILQFEAAQRLQDQFPSAGGVPPIPAQIPAQAPMQGAPPAAPHPTLAQPTGDGGPFDFSRFQPADRTLDPQALVDMQKGFFGMDYEPPDPKYQTPGFQKVYDAAVAGYFRGDILEREILPLAKSAYDQQQFDPRLGDQALVDHKTKVKNQIAYAKQSRYLIEKPPGEVTEKGLDWMEEQISEPVRDVVWGESGYNRVKDGRKTRLENRKKIQRAFALMVDPERKNGRNGRALR